MRFSLSQCPLSFSYMKIEIQTKLLITTAFSFSIFLLSRSEVFSKGSGWIYFLHLFACFSLQFFSGFYEGHTYIPHAIILSVIYS